MVRKDIVMNTIYPSLEINLKHIEENTKVVVSKCEEQGIHITGVFKGASGMPEIAKAMINGGCKSMASSRLVQLEKAREYGLNCEMYLIRIPMLTEVKDTIRLADVSLNSEITVIEALNEEAIKVNKTHGIILMADIGDLREGFWDYDELISVAKHIENDLKGLVLKGVGTNIGCYGSVAATYEKLNELVNISKRVEDAIGRKLEIVSGGATSSLLRIWDKHMPKGINHLRIGEGILLARDLDVFYGADMHELHQDAFRLKAEVIEVKNKPTHPIGELAVDAFGHTPTYTDRGIRKRALLGIGKVDYADPKELIVLEDGLEIIGASSDHTIIDIENVKRDIKVGDIIEFGVNYATLVFLTYSDNVHIKFI